jgi:hypothetical protein
MHENRGYTSALMMGQHDQQEWLFQTGVLGVSLAEDGGLAPSTVSPFVNGRLIKAFFNKPILPHKSDKSKWS